MREAIVQYKRQVQELQNQLTALQIAEFDSNMIKDKDGNQSSSQKNQRNQNQTETKFPQIPRLKSAS